MSEAHDDEDLILDTPAGEETQEAPEQHEETEGGDGEDALEVSFGDEAAPEDDDRNLPNKLRGVIRDKDKELAELRRKVAAATPEPAKKDLGPKPTMEGCEYDEDAYDAALLAWNEDKAAADDAGKKAQEAAEARSTEWAAKLQDFGQKKVALKAADFEVAENAVLAAMDQTQIAAIIEAADDSAKVIYAIGKHPAKLTELAKLTNPVQLIKAIVKLEGTIKVAPRRSAPEPEGTVRGSARLSPQADKVLEKLEAAAEKSGDRTAVIAYRREKRAAAR